MYKNLRHSIAIVQRTTCRRIARLCNARAEESPLMQRTCRSHVAPLLFLPRFGVVERPVYSVSSSVPGLHVADFLAVQKESKAIEF